MKFLIYRTRGRSPYHSTRERDENPPCLGAYVDGYVDHQVEHPRATVLRPGWYDEGYGHTSNELGQRERYIEKEGWFVDIDTLEQLVSLRDNVAERIIVHRYEDLLQDSQPLLAIEIYDDYRE